MARSLFVEDLPADMDEESLRAAFAEHGTVTKVEVIRDPETGESRGTGFVEMETDEDAERAANALHDTDIEGGKLQVNLDQPADPPPSMPPPSLSEPL